MPRKKRGKKGQISIESAMARVLLDTEARERAERKFVKGMEEVKKTKKELLQEAEKELPEFSRTYLRYRKEINEARNPLLKSLFVGKESAKLIVLTRIHMLKKQEGLLREETITEVLKTIRGSPSRYSKSRKLDNVLVETMERNLKGILAYESLSKRGKKELVGELARHKLFDRIIFNSDSKAYWIGRIIKEIGLKELK